MAVVQYAHHSRCCRHTIAATENQGERVIPYSLWSIVAPSNAVAVCPDGHELADEPSGRISLEVYFIVLTNPAIIPYDIAVAAA